MQIWLSDLWGERRRQMNKGKFAWTERKQMLEVRVYGNASLVDYIALLFWGLETAMFNFCGV